MQDYLHSVFLGGQKCFLSGPMGMPVMSMEFMLSVPRNHCCHSCALNCKLHDCPGGQTAAGKRSLFQARVPDGQPFISEEMGAICVLHHGILGDLTQLFKHVNHIFNHAHFQISLCFEVNWNLCGVKGKN